MRLLSACIALSLLVVSAEAQKLPFMMDMPLDGVHSFNADIPTPEQVIGHVIGSKHTVPHQVEQYFRAVAAVSDRVTVAEHARSYEGRPLIHALVSSPANHARLDEIRGEQVLLSDSPSSVSDDAIQEMPVVLMQSYSVHGNEASGTEAAILYLYYLAAGEGPAIDEALYNAVIIVEPMQNPDGRDRFADWVNRNRGGVATMDSQDREHSEPWPGGRTNHYWFDLNRDWMVTQHPESKGRIELFQTWRPQVLTDHHEMGSGSSFFFQPGIPSRKNPNTPELNVRLTEEIATYHAAGFDAIGSTYYSEEGYDDFFYGKGSAYPDINGSIGILFEQASSRALRATVSDGELHYAFTVRNQFVASLTTLKAGIAMRADLLTYQRDFYATSLEMAQKNRSGGWILDLDDGRTRAQLFAQLLKRHRVEFYELTQDVQVNGKTIRAGNGLVIPDEQPQYRLIDSFTERTLEYQDSLFYDVSTWTLPLAFDVNLHSYSGNLSSVSGEEVISVALDGGSLVGGEAQHAYLMRWNRFYAPRALNRFMEAGIPVNVAHKPFSILVDGEKVWFDRGTVVIPLKGRDTPGKTWDANTVHTIAKMAVKMDHVEITAAHTGLTPDGPDLGGGSMADLTKPRIAMTAGSGASSGQTGEAWHAISERFRMEVSLIEPSRFGGADLSRYNTIILTASGLSDAASNNILSWTRKGGNLIVLSGATSWALRNNLVDIESMSIDMDSLTENLDYHQMDEARGAQAIGGSIFQVDLDTSHPIAYGLKDQMALFHQGSTLYSFTGSPGQLIGSYSMNPLMSGYISEEKLAQLPGLASVIATGEGRGNVIAFMERLNFRAYWYGSQRLFFNSIFFGRSF